MKHLAILYTNNKISPDVLSKVVSLLLDTIKHPFLAFETQAVIVSANPISKHLISNSIEFNNIVAPSHILNKGHLSIIEKILLAMKCFPADCVSLHEHDVLYPYDYLYLMQNIAKDLFGKYDYLAYNNLIGVNKSGYLNRVIYDYPLSTLSFPSEVLVDLLNHKREEFFENENWCYIEPGYGGSYGAKLRRIEFERGYATPAVHINMNFTQKNHHLTNHYLTYESYSQIGFKEWPGDISYMFDE